MAIPYSSSARIISVSPLPPGTALRVKLTLPGEPQKLLTLPRSAFVQHVYRQIGIDLTPGINAKHTTPEDIAATAAPHTSWVLERDIGESKTKERVQKVMARVRNRSRAS